MILIFCRSFSQGKRWWVASDIWSDIGAAPWPADLDPQKEYMSA
jgi:hypothetical protein